MRAFLLLLATPACIPWEQPGADPSTTADPVDPGTTSTTGWQVPPRERVNAPVSTSTSTSTSTTSSAGPEVETTSLASTTGSAPAIDLSMLRLDEVHPDPEGKDGGPDSPEFIEIVHVGDEPLALAGLEIEARSWPPLGAADLGLADLSLAPGQRLTVARHTLPADVPAPTIDETGIRVAFAADGGLRNADGGVLLRSGDQPGDLMIYGAAQPAPWDGDGWIGAPAPSPGSGSSLCRLADDDHDDASDWSLCPSSPGSANAPEVIDTTGDMSGTTGESTGTTGEPLPAEVVIVEVLSNPPGPGSEEKYAEFVEVVNLGPGSVDLATWTIADALAGQPTGADLLLYGDGDGGCAPETCLAAGQRAIIVGNLYDGPTGPGLVLVTDDTTLANGGLAVHEPVALRDAEGVLRSTYRAWADPLVAPDPALSEQALVRASAGAADAAEAWSFAEPTPGL